MKFNETVSILNRYSIDNGSIQYIGDIPVFEGKIRKANASIVQDELKQALDKFQEEDGFKPHPVWKSHQLSDVHFNNNFLTTYNCNLMFEEIRNACSAYVAAIGSDPTWQFSLMQSWLTRTGHREYAHIHNHGYSQISGAYYIDTIGDDGDIYFPYPHISTSNSIFLQHLMKSLDIRPENGKLILFPGWLMHGVRTNTTEHNRISLSFNIQMLPPGFKTP